MHNDRPLPGILLMATFCVMAPIADVMAKMLGDTVPVIQIVTFRLAIRFLILLPVVLLAKAIAIAFVEPFLLLLPGWLVFRDIPNGLAATGILITVVAGLYILMRERRLAIDALA